MNTEIRNAKRRLARRYKAKRGPLTRRERQVANLLAGMPVGRTAYRQLVECDSATLGALRAFDRHGGNLFHVMMGGCLSLVADHYDCAALRAIGDEAAGRVLKFGGGQ